MKKLKLPLICLTALALSACNALPKFPTDRVWETDTEYAVCGEYQIIDAKNMKVAFVRDWPLSKCNGNFGFATKDASRVFQWSRRAQEYVEKNCK